jgi:aarF domain-containing kinase
MMTPRGDVALIDFGQVKQLGPEVRLGLARIMLLLDACGGGADDGCSVDYAPFAEAVKALGVKFKPGVPDETAAAAALAFWLFDSTATTLPGGYDASELSAGSPVAEVASFPQDLVFVGRATVLIRGLATRLGVRWSLAREWAPQARAALATPEEAAAAAKAVAAAAAAARRRGALDVVRAVVATALAAMAAAVARWLAAVRRALFAAFKPAFGHMRNTAPADGCAFTP